MFELASVALCGGLSVLVFCAVVVFGVRLATSGTNRGLPKPATRNKRPENLKIYEDPSGEKADWIDRFISLKHCSHCHGSINSDGDCSCGHHEWVTGR
jgi:hypothetical protein